MNTPVCSVRGSRDRWSERPSGKRGSDHGGNPVFGGMSPGEEATASRRGSHGGAAACVRTSVHGPLRMRCFLVFGNVNRHLPRSQYPARLSQRRSARTLSVGPSPPCRGVRDCLSSQVTTRSPNPGAGLIAAVPACTRKAHARMEKLKYHDILYNDAQLGPYPDHLLKRVDKPTNDIPGPVERRSERESVFSKSLMGDFGEELSREFKRMTQPLPHRGALQDLQWYINKYAKRRPPVAAKRAPIPDDPRVLSRHLKAMGYFLGADIVRIGRWPSRRSTTKTSCASPWRRRTSTPSCSADEKTPRRCPHPTGGTTCRPGELSGLSEAGPADRVRPTICAAWASTRPHQHEQLLHPHAPDRARRRHGRGLAHGDLPEPLPGLQLQVRGRAHQPGARDRRLRGLRPAEVLRKVHHLCRSVPLGVHSRGPKTLYNGYYTWKLDSRTCSDFDILNREGACAGAAPRCARGTAPTWNPATTPLGRQPGVALKDRGRAA